LGNTALGQWNVNWENRRPETPAKEKEVLIVEHSTENLENEIHTSQRMLAEGGFAAQNEKSAPMTQAEQCPPNYVKLQHATISRSNLLVLIDNCMYNDS